MASHMESSEAATLPSPAAEKGTSRRMFLLALWLAWAAWIVNFDNGFAGVVLIMPSFNKAFGTCIAGQCALDATRQSLIAVSFIFAAVGAGIAGPLGSWLGRKRVIR